MKYFIRARFVPLKPTQSHRSSRLSLVFSEGTNCSEHAQLDAGKKITKKESKQATKRTSALSRLKSIDLCYFCLAKHHVCEIFYCE